MWAPEQTSVVELVDDEHVVSKMVYALSNPVKDFLIEKAHHWPGVTSLAAVIANKAIAATKPKTFFRPDGDLPDVVSLSFHLPRGLNELPRGEFTKRIQERIAVVEREAVAERGVFPQPGTGLLSVGALAVSVQTAQRTRLVGITDA